MIYLWVKTVHISTVIFTISFFIIRFIGMINHAKFIEYRWVRRISQINDTILLLAGITLATMSHQYPFVAPWLTAKLAALLLYITLGMVALKWGRTRRRRIISGLLALICAGYIVSVALTRTPQPWEVLLGSNSTSKYAPTALRSGSSHPRPTAVTAYDAAVSSPVSENG